MRLPIANCRLPIVVALLVGALAVQGALVPTNSVASKRTFHAATITKQSAQLKPAAVVAPPVNRIWIGITLPVCHTLQYSTNALGSALSATGTGEAVWVDTLTTNAPTLWVSLPVPPGPKGFFRVKTQNELDPASLVVSSNAPTP